ncbi:hypothetical protein L6164_034307 [Bauhinia variegata]|uniref:Uncharacterized protein n=1 Tax=Bauhinia variegata TaxID=167791 RepID=A0ACB9KUF7_BAUVA|nr:hypothetical protein L6164_034307 [Bauhinia variegata]
MEGETLYLQLHKLSAIKSESTLEHLLSTLWKTRKTGLSSPEKSHFQSLLQLPSLSEVDPVLACLRSLIRKSAYQNFTGDDLLKLFPPDLPLDLQSILVISFQKCQDQWREDIPREQRFSPRTSTSYQVRTNVQPYFASLPPSEMSTSPWPRQDDPLTRLNGNDVGISTPLLADTNVTGLASCFQSDIASENLENLPRLKSMTWTMENRGSSQADKVAIISLKLHDYSMSPLGETEVKFQLSRDTLEAMLRSMTYITEQLSKVGTSSEPANKKQKQ